MASRRNTARGTTPRDNAPDQGPGTTVGSERPDLAAALADLPARVRVHDIARRAGINSREVMAALAQAGVEVGSASSSVDREIAQSLLTSMLGGAPAAATEPEPAEVAGDGSRGPVTDGGALFLEPADDTAEADDARHRRRRGRRGRGRPEGPSQDGSPVAEADAAGRAAAGGSADEGGVTDPGASGDGARATADEPSDGAAAPGHDDGERQGRHRRRGGRGRRGSGRGEPAQDGHAGDAAMPGDAASGDSARETTAEEPRHGATTDDVTDDAATTDDADASPTDAAKGGSRRRRRRRRSGSADGGEGETDDVPANTVVHVREPRSGGSDSAGVQGVRGSTRLEAKRQRRRDSRDSRRRPQILSEAEFLARRESVDRVMAVRQRGDLAQVALLEDGVLVEHFVSRSGSASMIGNVYLGRVQNVLPSMEAAFVDIGERRNAVLYAGEVNWDMAGLEGKERRIETALSSGDTVLAQVSKDPIGHKGARLTTQISLPGRFLVFVPGGGATGISRKLPDNERKRLKGILDRIIPGDAGVIIRTAAEGVGEDDLAGDVARLKAQWEQISAAAGKASSAPSRLYAEPDTLIKVIRDLFNSDINRLLIDGDDAWESVSQYVLSVAPELADRVSRYVGDSDVFAAFRIDEQISKALARKVHLPSGGSLVIDRTEAMTVIDVNTGKFTGSGGNLEETVTRNNLEAAEEIVRQLRLRDIGGIIVVDFIDMVLESNRDLVLRRLTECLGRDRTRHQVAEVTSLGLVQMTRKRMGLGLVEAFSEACPHCGGRGILLHDAPADTGSADVGGSAGADGDGGDGGEGGGHGRRKGRKQGRQRDGRDEGARFEPLVVERVTAAAKPDPRGPKAPTLFRSAAEPAGESEEAPGGDGHLGAAPDNIGAATTADVTVTHFAAPAADAVLPTDTDTPAEAAAAVDGDPAPAISAVEPSIISRPTRRRRAAGRPAGAPDSAAGAVDLVLAARDGSHAEAYDSAPGDLPAEAHADAATDGAAAGVHDGAVGVATPVAAVASASSPANGDVPAKPRRRRASTRAAGPARGQR